MKYPLVSIVTPSYNQAHFLEFAIQSVINQGYPNLEYIIVDGGSTDGSVEIIRRYEQHLAWWVSEKDHGQAEAINKGFEHATGEIFAWLNSDDLFLPGAIQSAMAFFEQDANLGFVYGNAVTIDEWGNPLHLLLFDEMEADDFLSFRMICQPAVFFRRSAWEACGGLDESLHYMLDHDLWQRMVNFYPVRHANELWAAARHHPQAKNVQHAERFANEIDLLTQRVIEAHNSTLTKSRLKKIWGGSYRLQARYYLDGDRPLASLKAYLRAFWCSPNYTLEHKHRILYALLKLLGMAKIAEKKRIKREQERQKRAAREVFFQLQKKQYREWQGISLPNLT